MLNNQQNVMLNRLKAALAEQEKEMKGIEL